MRKFRKGQSVWIEAKIEEYKGEKMYIARLHGKHTISVHEDRHNIAPKNNNPKKEKIFNHNDSYFFDGERVLYKGKEYILSKTTDSKVIIHRGVGRGFEALLLDRFSEKWNEVKKNVSYNVYDIFEGKEHLKGCFFLLISNISNLIMVVN